MTHFDYFVSGEDEPGVVYHRTDYTRKVYKNYFSLMHSSSVTIGDFRDHKPGGEFHVDPVCGEIREYFDNGDYEVVARSGI